MKSKKAVKREMNFYDRYLYDPQKEERKRKLLLFLGPIAALLVVTLVAFTFFQVGTVVANDAIDDHNQYISQPKNVKDYEESQTLDSQRQELIQQYEALNTVIVNIASYPVISNTLLSNTNSAVGSAASVTGMTYDASTGVLVVSIESSSASGIPAAVKRIKSAGLYDTVTYTGYQTSGDGYTANITCMPK